MNSTRDDLRRRGTQDVERFRRLRRVVHVGLPTLLCFGGLLLGVSAQNLGPEESPRNLHGTVVNSVTHEPIGHALVFSPDNLFATMTDDQGHFEFPLPRLEAGSEHNRFPVGSVDAFKEEQKRIRSLGPTQLGARKPGFLEEGAEQNIAQDQKEVTISLIPEALIVGRVVGPDEADRIPVVVYVRQVQDGRASWVQIAAVITKSNGEFRFATLRAGKYKLLTQELLDRDPLTFDPRGQLYGYAPVYFPSAPDFASAATIELAAGGTFQATLSPIRQAYHQVRVPIANASTDSQIRVGVFPQGHRGPGFTLGYNPQAQRIEGLLPDGNYTVEAMSEGSAPLNGTLSIAVKGGPLQGPPLTLVPSGSVAVNVKEDFSLAENTRPDIRILNGRSFEMKGPARYLNVMLWPDDNFGLESSPSVAPLGRPDGPLTITAQPGRYWVQANSSRGFPASITSGGIDLQRHPIVVGSGGSVLPIEIAMRDDWARITAKIEHPDGSLHDASAISGFGIAASGPVAITNAYAWVCLVPLPDGPGMFQQFGIPLNGETGEAQVAPGEYRVLAFDHQPRDLEYHDPDAMRAYDGKGPVVRLLPGQKDQVTLPLITPSESQ